MTRGQWLAFDLVVVFGVAFGLTLVLSAPWRRENGQRVRGFALAPAIVGIALAVALLLRWSGELGDLTARIAEADRYPARLSKTPAIAWALALVAAGAAVVAADSLLARIIPVLARVLAFAQRVITRTANPARWWSDVAAWAVLVAAACIAFGSAEVLRSDTGASAVGSAQIESEYDLPNYPIGAALIDDRSGYITLYPDTIAKFELPASPGGELKLETVIDDLSFPRALAILGDTLYVSELGTLLCDDPGQFWCLPEEGAAAEVRSLNESSGRILAFDIAADGSLGGKRTIIDDLPIVDYQHSLNALSVGPDGRIYATVAGVAQLGPTPEVLDGIDRDLSLLGSVVSFEPDGSDLQVYANGLRNPFDLTWDPSGRLYTVDNDGGSAGGWRLEEVIQLERGKNYGWPYVGTFDGWETHDGHPIWLRRGVASAGGEWGERVGLGPGLVVSGFGVVELIPLEEPADGGRPYVPTPGVTKLLDLNGIYDVASVVQALPDGRLLLGVVSSAGGHQLLVVRASR